MTAEGSQYLVITFVEGVDLAQVLATRGRQEACRLCCRKYAHIVGNLIGQLILGDFQVVVHLQTQPELR